jgi:hypothetical protein
MKATRTIIRRMLPQSLATWIGGRLRGIKHRFVSMRSPERVFTGIYRNHAWGDAPGGICSGGGSHDTGITDSYLGLIRDHARSHAFHESTFVDLGCGDMEVGRHLIPLCRVFVGVDVVRFVIDRHRTEMGGDSVDFIHLDMVDDDLPDGDICFVRQVFQHMSNRQVGRVLPKLRKYRRVYITEHLPSGASPWIPNLDKPQGAGIRLDVGSGIDLTAAPFGIPGGEVRLLLEVRGNDAGGGRDPGIIRTVLYTPGSGSSEPVGACSHERPCA